MVPVDEADGVVKFTLLIAHVYNLRQFSFYASQ